MLTIAKNLYTYRELIATLAWKNILVRYKQAYFGIAWAVIKPFSLMLIFSLVRSIVGIETGDIPYPILTFAALLPWVFFQESTSEGVNSVTSNVALVRKIYFPRVIFPLTAMVTKLIELGVSFFILSLMMIYYEMVPTVYILWVPAIILYTIIVALAISLFGAALHVFFRDVGQVLPILLSLLMYASPVIYPLSLVQTKLLEERAAGEWSDFLYTLYTFNPLAGIIDSFQRVLLKGLPPDFSAIAPGLIFALIMLPLSYSFFRRAEAWFADVI